MLNGVDPIIIFNLKKLSPSLQASVAKIPIVASVVSSIDLPLIPIYLSERLTGICITAESKSIEIDTDLETLSSGENPVINQRGIQNNVKIEMIASADSIGVSLFSALSDLIFPKVTSKEYSITYLHGAITVFGGLLHSFNIQQNTQNNLYEISIELIKPKAITKAGIVNVPRNTGATPL